MDSKTTDSARVAQLLLREPPGEHGHGLQPRPLGGLAVPGGVAHHHRLVGAGLLHGGLHEVGLGLGGLHVARGGPAVHELARVEQVEVVIHLVGLGRAGQHHRVAVVLEVHDQVARARERLDLLDQREVERLLGRPDVVALLALHLLAGERLHELVAAHPDVPVDAPDRAARSRAGGRLGTRRSCAGSWCRRGCRPRRGSRLEAWPPLPSGGVGPNRLRHASRPGPTSRTRIARGDE